MAVPGSTDRSLDAAGQRQNTGRKERTVPGRISPVGGNGKNEIWI